MKRDTRQMNEFISEITDDLKKLPFDMLEPEYAAQINAVAGSIERAGKEFNANLFLVLAFGPVKSGKSTLINILARENEVSPTEFGIECTMRPSIIIKTRSKPKICRYISKGNSFHPEQEKENFNLVLDYIRGISDRSEIQKRVIIEEYPLTIERIQKFVSGKNEDYSDLGSEPLITVIEVEAEDSLLLDEHTAIVDVPGLDGMKANWRSSPVQEWILTRSDFLLFVQSSIAALNSETIQFLKEVYINSKEPPMQLVQNIIEAKHWLGQDYLMKVARKQRDKGVEEITKLIPISQNRHFDSSQVNLGKAHDAIFGLAGSSAQELYKSSGMEGMERKLYELLCSRREDIMWSNSQKGLKNTLEGCRTSLRGLEEDAREKYLALETVMDKINKAKTTIGALKTRNARELVKAGNNKRLEEYIGEILDSYRRGYKVIFQDYYQPAGEMDTDIKKDAIYETRNAIKKAVESRLFCYDSSVSEETLLGIRQIISENIQNCVQELGQFFSDTADIKLNMEPSRYKYLINNKDFGAIFFPLPCDKEISKPKKISIPKQSARDYENIFRKDFDTMVETFLAGLKDKLVDFFEKNWRIAVDKFEEEFAESIADLDRRFHAKREQFEIISHSLPYYEERIDEGIRMINQEL